MEEAEIQRKEEKKVRMRIDLNLEIDMISSDG